MKTITAARVETPAARARLPIQGKPHWAVTLDEGCHLGYRRSTASGAWVARAYVGKAYITATLALADDNGPADGHAVLSFTQAQARARDFFVEKRRAADGVGPAKGGPYTIGDMMADYLAKLGKERRSTLDTITGQVNAHIVGPLGSRPAAKFRPSDFNDWLHTVANGETIQYTTLKRPVTIRDGESEREFLRRRRASANRIGKNLKAAFVLACESGKLAGRPRFKLLGGTEIENERRYFSHAEAARVLDSCDGDELRHLVRGGLECGGRFFELAGMRVKQFKPDLGKVWIEPGKTGVGRYVTLGPDGAAFFAGITKDRSPRDLMFPDPVGAQWDHSKGSKMFLEACAAADVALDYDGKFHILRRTFASLRLIDGASLQTISKQLGHKSIVVTQKHYGYLAEHYIDQQMRASAPSFGEVIPLRRAA